MLCTDTISAGWTDARDESLAANELFNQIGNSGDGPGFFFCSSEFDLDRLGRELAAVFGNRLVGCTTAGEITPAGYRCGTLTGFTFPGASTGVESHLLEEISKLGPDVAESIGKTVREAESRDRRNGFGLLLSDGSALAEDRILSLLKPEVGDLPVVGGSAAGSGGSCRSKVYFGGRFHGDAAVFSHVRTPRSIHAFQVHHFEPTSRRMIITRADASMRLVLELNGRPAAAEYARLIGCDPDGLDANTFARHPLMVKVGREYYVRAIQQVQEGGGLKFLCPVREGLVLNCARPLDILQQTQGAFARVHEALDPDFIIGFDSVLRRRELSTAGLLDRMDEILVENRVLGFNTCGEQAAGIHCNQSLVGVAISR